MAWVRVKGIKYIKKCGPQALEEFLIDLEICLNFIKVTSEYLLGIKFMNIALKNGDSQFPAQGILIDQTPSDEWPIILILHNWWHDGEYLIEVIHYFETLW